MSYLNVYIIGRAYGGPEEGGWWYDYHEWVYRKNRETSDEELAELNRRFKRGDYNVEDILGTPADWLDQGYGPLTNQCGFGDHDGRDPAGHGDDAYLIPGGVWGDEKVKAFIEDFPAKNHPTETPYYC
jgi:hypothetical protein|tara:strand:+ start:2251 stop:2634 length:384 start_codon:yes stop_codon:yes gene_type:complete